MEYHKISDSDISILETITLALAQPDKGNEFQNITRGMEIAAKYIWVLGAIANGHVADSIPDGGGVFRRFYNETASLIVNDAPRTIRVESWCGIIRDMVSDYVDQQAESIGNVGNLVVLTSRSNTGLNARQLGRDDLNKSLLSYAPYEIMERWIYSRSGINDMLQSILLMVIVYKTFNADNK